MVLCILPLMQQGLHRMYWRALGSWLCLCVRLKTCFMQAQRLLHHRLHSLAAQVYKV